MTIQIHRFLKSNLSKQELISVSLAGMSNSSSMTISHYAYANKSTEATLPYTLETVREHVPYTKETEFCVVLRTKVDLTATGPNEAIIKDNGKDIGKYKYVDQAPSRPVDLPPGFQELYRK